MVELQQERIGNVHLKLAQIAKRRLEIGVRFRTKCHRAEITSRRLGCLLQGLYAGLRGFGDRA